MGLLDDAIREHLELKRLRGADPGVVAREEHEALGATQAGEPHVGNTEGVEGLAPVDLVDGDDEPGERGAVEPREVAGAGQETLELDMRTVLYEQSDGDTGDIAAVLDEAGRHRPSTEESEQEQLRFEQRSP